MFLQHTWRCCLETRPYTQVLNNGTHVYAKDVRPGDQLHYLDGAAFRSSTVRITTETTKTGLYNPYTLSGSIVVDGVAASCHSSWILDGVAFCPVQETDNRIRTAVARPTGRASSTRV